MIPKLFIGITPTCFKSGSIYKIDQKSREVCGIDNRRGVMPDYLVSNTIEDEIHKKDKVLDFTIDLIKKE